MTTFYRVDRVNKYKDGDVIELTKPDSIPPQFSKIIDMIAPLGLSPHGHRYFAAPVPAGHKNVAIDFALELFRRSFHNSRPSRYECIFAWDCLENAQLFRKQLLTEFPDATIYRVSTESKNIHRGDMSILSNDKTNLVYAEILNMYWEGRTYQEKPFWEFLLPLPVTIHEIIK